MKISYIGRHGPWVLNILKLRLAFPPKLDNGAHTKHGKQTARRSTGARRGHATPLPTAADVQRAFCVPAANFAHQPAPTSPVLSAERCTFLVDWLLGAFECNAALAHPLRIRTHMSWRSRLS